MAKILAAVALIAAIAGILWAVYDNGYESGVADEKLTQQAVIKEAKSKEKLLVDELFKERAKRKVKVSEKIKYITKAIDPTGCLDTPYSAMGLQ